MPDIASHSFSAAALPGASFAPQPKPSRLEFLLKRYVPILKKRIDGLIDVPDVQDVYDEFAYIVHSSPKAKDFPGELFDVLASYDPTPHKQYLERIMSWVLGSKATGVVTWSYQEQRLRHSELSAQARQYNEPAINLEDIHIFRPEDWWAIQDTLEFFEKVKNKPSHYAHAGPLTAHEKDIRNYTSLKALQKTLDRFWQNASLENDIFIFNDKAIDALNTSGAEFIAGDDPRMGENAAQKQGWSLLRITTEEAAKSLGEGSRWCTTWGHFGSYEDDLLWLHNTQTAEKFQIHVESGQCMDWKDDPVSVADLLAAHDGLQTALTPYVEKGLQALQDKEYIFAPDFDAIKMCMNVSEWQNLLTKDTAHSLLENLYQKARNRYLDELLTIFKETPAGQKFVAHFISETFRSPCTLKMYECFKDVVVKHSAEASLWRDSVRSEFITDLFEMASDQKQDNFFEKLLCNSIHSPAWHDAVPLKTIAQTLNFAANKNDQFVVTSILSSIRKVPTWEEAVFGCETVLRQLLYPRTKHPHQAFARHDFSAHVKMHASCKEKILNAYQDYCQRRGGAPSLPEPKFS